MVAAVVVPASVVVGIVVVVAVVVCLSLSARKRREWKCEATLMRVSMECAAEFVAAAAAAAMAAALVPVGFADFVEVDVASDEEEKQGLYISLKRARMGPVSTTL